ncbi:MAG: peptidoglycan DD-metalloendopeptidase family protein, partial [Patulibacter sp.]
MVDPPPLIRPTPGPVRDGFHYDRSRPFVADQRRGVRLAARPGDAVAAPCGGRVRFAGRTPQGDAVTVACGGWTTTLLGVASTVRRNAAVTAGQRVG